MAGAAGAERLVLLKPVAGLYRTWPPTGEPIARLTVDELAALQPAGVDEHLPAALRAAGVETWVIDGRDPARLAELLDEGRTAGTRRDEELAPASQDVVEPFGFVGCVVFEAVVGDAEC